SKNYGAEIYCFSRFFADLEVQARQVCEGGFSRAQKIIITPSKRRLSERCALTVSPQPRCWSQKPLRSSWSLR
ncbi:hypothetical protein ACLQ9Q_16995, partial [Bordetella avium]|uniref:hypothetical protein n=1 Tax=Bordetella avium TaxID=521 RepID=UPI0039FD40DC